MSDRDPDRTVNYLGEGKLQIDAKDGESVQLEVDEKNWCAVENPLSGWSRPSRAGLFGLA